MSFNNKQSGDTIIEVLLAMSVIGLVLGAAFGIANRSVQIGQDAQERTEALKIAESQLEIFKSEFAGNTDLQTQLEDSPFCLDNSKAILDIIESSEPECSGINGNGQTGLYNVSIIPPGALNDPTGAYEFRVTWTRLGGTSNENGVGTNNLSLYFKPGSL
jgi:prepilin-type N-terminal cleavage/methylation domain-containing protein